MYEGASCQKHVDGDVTLRLLVPNTVLQLLNVTLLSLICCSDFSVNDMLD
jgi:hypothetical protein